MATSPLLPKTIAGVRIATSVFFLLFGEYKVMGPGFAHGGFQTYLRDFIANGAVSFYRPFLSGFVLPHAVFLGYVVGVWELLIGMVNMLLSTWWEAGHGVPVWRYFGAELDHLPLLLLLIVLFAADAGRVWGLDGRRG
jgi:uncharacterized membrane protein YphA (DoxX/SURF4 family)